MRPQPLKVLRNGKGNAVFLLPLIFHKLRNKMKDLQIFNSQEFGRIRTLADESESPLFCAADVCTALGFANGRDAVAKHVDEGDVAKRDTPTSSGTQAMTFVNESGLYALIFGSKLPKAKAFKRWITSEVLPSIRRTGAYAVSLPGETQEEMIARALITAQQTMARQENEIMLLRQLNSEKERTIELQKMVIEGGRQALPSGKTYTTTRIAEELGMDPRELNRQLNARGVQRHEGKRWPIADRYARSGFRTKVAHSYRYANVDLTTMREEWTEKGREFILSLFNIVK